MKIFKRVIIGSIIAILIAVIILEVILPTEKKIITKVLSQCDFKKDKISLDTLFYKYWELRNVQAESIENKGELVQLLFSMFALEDEGCDASIFNELEHIAFLDYEFYKYRDSNGHSLIVHEILIQNSVTVSWLLNHSSFANTTITDENSPYFNQNIYELAVSLDKEESTPSTKDIVLLLEQKLAGSGAQ